MNRWSGRVRWVSLGLACVLALPLPLGRWAGFHLRLSPFLALQSWLAGAPLLRLALPAGIVLLLALWRERWFCRYACPTGALCDAVASCRRKASPAWERFPHLNRLLAVTGLAAAMTGVPILAGFDPLALFHGAWTPVHWDAAAAAAGAAGGLGLAAVLVLTLLRPRLWCRRFCPLGGLQELVAAARRAGARFLAVPKAATGEGEPGLPATSAAGSRTAGHPLAGGPWLGRRQLLAVAAGVAGGLALRRTAGAGKALVLRPPGALPEARFPLTCCRCGNCMRACPTRILEPVLTSRQPLGVLTPQVVFTRGYCLETCAACGSACPTGAIAPFRVDEKGRLFIGTARIRTDACLLLKGRECDRCVVSCTYRAIRIEGGVFEPRPEVDASRCVGCGACAVVCPAGVVRIEPSAAAPQTRAAEAGRLFAARQ